MCWKEKSHVPYRAGDLVGDGLKREGAGRIWCGIWRVLESCLTVLLVEWEFPFEEIHPETKSPIALPMEQKASGAIADTTNGQQIRNSSAGD